MRWILRPDLQILPSDAAGGGEWVVKDPLRLTYFRAPAEELAFLSLLDGRLSLSQLVQALQRRFPDSCFSLQNLSQFLASAISGGLLRSTECGFGSWVSAVSSRRRSRRIRGRMLSLLVHRVRGIDPTRLLQVLYPWLAWLFRPGVAMAAAAFTVCMAVIVGVRMQQIEWELPRLLQSLLTVQNLPYIVTAVIFVKILHELGHALACHHFGGECHELGFLVVGFVPLLYCDVSDTWSQENRWYRMLVAAAGILVELFMAALFGFLWVFTLPGTLHSFCLNAMVVCSVNTLLINGNPLLRYDGYYVLCDLIQMPNLSAESRATCLGWVNRFFFGVPTVAPSGLSAPGRAALGLYGLSSMLYRLMMMVLILTGIHQMLSAVGLEALSFVFVCSVVLSQVIGVSSVVGSAAAQAPTRPRFITGLGTLITVLLMLLLIPLPYSIEAPFVVTPGIAAPVYVGAAGYLEPHIQYGQQVTAGMPLVTLKSPDLEEQLARSEGDVAVHEARLNSLISRRGLGVASGNAIPAAENALESCRQRLKTTQLRIADLHITSPADGIIIPPRNRVNEPTDGTTAREWSGRPLDDVNQGVWLDEQTLLCWVGQHEDLRASAFLQQSDIELIPEGASAELTFSSSPGNTRGGRVAFRGPAPETDLPRELSIRQMVVADPLNPSRPAETLYSVQISFTDGAGTAPVYATGFAKIRCQPTSLASRLWRYARHTFAFRL